MFIGGDADSLVRNLDDEDSVFERRCCTNLARLAELDCIADDIQEDLPQLAPVALNSDRCATRESERPTVASGGGGDDWLVIRL